MKHLNYLEEGMHGYEGGKWGNTKRRWHCISEREVNKVLYKKKEACLRGVRVYSCRKIVFWYKQNKVCKSKYQLNSCLEFTSQYKNKDRKQSFLEAKASLRVQCLKEGRPGLGKWHGDKKGSKTMLQRISLKQQVTGYGAEGIGLMKLAEEW